MLELAGELDLYAAAQLNASLAEAVDEHCRRLVLDMRDATRVDFAVIAIVVQTGRALDAREARLEVVCAEGEASRLLETAARRAPFDVTVERGARQNRHRPPPS